MKTITSLQISELTGKRHDNVRADIRKLGDNLNTTLEQELTPPKGGRPSASLILPRDFAVMILSQYGRFDLLKQILDGVNFDELVPHVRRREYDFGEVVSNLFSGYEVLPQFPILDGKYRIDWYIPELNLAIEYDECHHKYDEDADRRRQAEI